MAQFKVKFQLKNGSGSGTGAVIDDVVEAPNLFVAKDLINRKYGGVQIWFGPTLINEPKASAASVSTASGTSGGSQPNGCMLALGAVVFLVAVATGAFKTSTQPDSPQPTASQEQAASQEQKASEEQTADSQPSAPAEAPQIQQQLYGAFAISPSTSKSAYSTGYQSESEAKQAAIGSCGESDCYASVTFGPGCAALAESDRAWYSSSGKTSESDANNAAMESCQAKDSDANCRITASVNF